MVSKYKKVISFLIAVIVGLFIWFSPIPNGVDPKAWQLFAIFVFTVIGIITKPLPMGAMALIGLTLIVGTKTLAMDEAFIGFSHKIVWLVVVAFFIARGFIKTGLGSRVAYGIISVLGNSTLGMAYGIVVTDLLMAPAIPSLTARTGGIIFPVISSLSKAFGSEPHSNPRKVGSFLFLIAFQSAMVTSAMFLTSMAGNPLVADMASKVGVNLTWGSWALAASVPGALSLILIPLVIYKFYPPELKKTPDAKEFSKNMLRSLGKMKSQEYIMLTVFILLIILWVFGSSFSMNATTAALIGLTFLMIFQVLSWDEIIKEKGAWNTLIWFSVLIMMATYLSKLGLTQWFSEWVVSHIRGFDWKAGFLILSLVYFFSHYFFASNVAHIGSMFAPFLILSVAIGTPAGLAALLLAFYSSLFGGLTHYGCGPAPILFGAGYVKTGAWWKFGFIIGVLNIIIWMFVGGFWWKLIGMY